MKAGRALRVPFPALAAAVLALALGVRLAVALAHLDSPLSFDPADYDRHAHAIASHFEYPAAYGAAPGPTAFRPPGFPAFLAAVFALTGDGSGAGRVAQALVGTVVVALVGLVAWQLGDRRAGLVAGAIAAVYPPLVVIGATLLSEPLFIALLLGAVAAALHQRRLGTGVRWAALAGACAGLAWLTRTMAPIAFVPLALLVWTRRPRWSQRALAAPAMLLSVALLMAVPWTVRNAVVLKAFVPVSDQGGYTLAGTYNETSRRDPVHPGLWRPPHIDAEYRRLMTEGRPTEHERNRRLGAAARRYALDHPGYAAEVAWRNTVRMLQLDGPQVLREQMTEEADVGRGWADVATWAFYVVALVALLGAATPFARRVPAALWLVPLGMFAVVFIEPGLRLRAPVDVFLIVLAAAALVTAASRRSA